MNKDNGGPAFVFPGFEFFDTRANDGVGERVVYEPHKGMNLRDYFAAKAMQAVIHEGCYDYEEGGSDTAIARCRFAARDAYAFADAMLAERAK